jgi:hypothetical protein
LQKPEVFTTSGRTNFHLFKVFEKNKLLSARHGKFSPVKSGQWYRLFQLCHRNRVDIETKVLKGLTMASKCLTLEGNGVI